MPYYTAEKQGHLLAHQSYAGLALQTLSEKRTFFSIFPQFYPSRIIPRIRPGESVLRAKVQIAR